MDRFEHGSDLVLREKEKKFRDLRAEKEISEKRERDERFDPVSFLAPPKFSFTALLKNFAAYPLAVLFTFSFYFL